MAITKLEHVEIRVTDVEAAVAFNLEVVGLNEIGRDGDTVYLGCGLDDNFDLAISPGGTGHIHTAFAVHAEEDLDNAEKRINDAGAAVDRRTNGEPGQLDGIRFEAPGGGTFELVLMEGQENYIHPSRPRLGRSAGFAPRDLDHVNLMVPNPAATYEFLRDAVGLRGSDLFYPAPDVLAAAWMRVSTYHHDLAFLQAPTSEQTLHHVAFTMDSFEHMKLAADLLSTEGVMLEAGLGRHGHGGNLFGYFMAPGGNRYEICAEMGRLPDPDFPPGVCDEIGMSSWGLEPMNPEAFYTGT